MSFVLYRSSAGSGKTYTLVKEYLKIILQNPEKFKHTLAITFTNKAAEEMKDRIMQSLKRLAKNEDKQLEETLLNEIPQPLKSIDKISSDILTTLLHNYSDFAIMTIDSFIHKVIKAFALEIGLPLNFGIDLNYEKIETFVIEKLMASVGKDEFITDIILKFVFDRVKAEKSWNIEGDIRKFEKELFNEKNYEWVRAMKGFDITYFNIYLDQLNKIRDDYISTLNRLGLQGLELMRGASLEISDFPYGAKGAAGFLEKCANMRTGNIKMEIAKRFLDQQWTKKSGPKDIQGAIGNLLDNGLSDVAEGILNHMQANRAEAMTAAAILDNIYLAAIINRLQLLIDEYKKLNNVIPIAEFNIKVNEIVNNSPVPFIYAILGEKYTHYLVDEFQDTSRMQWENLFPLIDNTLAGGNFNMAVGDGKQSIYRWRGGDVEIMETDVNNKINRELLKIEQLENNYRSRFNVVFFNNKFFQRVSESYKEKNILLEQIYSDISQKPVRMTGGFVSLQFIDSDNENGDDADTLVCRDVKSIIDACVERNYDYGDIAILVRENKKGRIVAEYLLEAGIQVVSPDSVILSRVPLIRFLVDTLAYLNNPADKIKKASIVHFLGMYGLEEPMEPVTIGEQLMGDAPSLVSDRLREFFSRRNFLIRMPIYELVEEIIRIFNLPDLPDFKSHGYLQAFLNVVSSYSSDNSVDLPSFMDWWEFNKDQFSLVVPENKPAVKIMTIHKAKGLEFPVVIIPYADWEHKLDKQLWLYSEPPPDTKPPLNIPMPVNTTKSLEETFFKRGLLNEKDKVTIDNINLLYVAFTRAVDQLYIISQRKKNNVNYQHLEQHAASLMLKDENREDRYTFSEPFSNTREETPQELDFDDAEAFISNKWYNRITIRRKSTEFWRFGPDYPAEKRNWGILVHQLLSRLEKPGDVDLAVSRALAAGDIETNERDTLKQKLDMVFENPQAAEWFKPGLTVFTEAPVITDDGILRPDRVVIDGDRAIIIDFKTGGKNKSHIHQMQTYGKAVRDMGYKTIETYLYYLETDEIERVNKE